MKKMNIALVVIAGGSLALAGCNQSTPAKPTVTDNSEVSETNVVTEANVAEPVSKGPSVTTNAAAEADFRPEPPSPDAQTQDDADATGMTARVHRDEAPANETTAP